MSDIIYILVGAIIVLAVWIPLFTRGSPISVPMIAVTGGFFAPLPNAVSDPMVEFAPVIQHVTEVVLLSAIYSTGLKVDRRFSFRRWGTTWRLLLIVMPLSILLVALAGHWMLGLPVGMAIALGAILAPTDPVLASDVQVGPPGTGEEDDVRFGLTTEAGLNDGVAFPFVMLGVLITEDKIASVSSLLDWSILELAIPVLGGAAVGVLTGIGIIYGNRLFPERMRLSATKSGVVGLAIAFIIFGACELGGINGFVAVFCQAIAVRNFRGRIGYHRMLAHTTEQIELVIMVFVMTFFGFALSHGLLAGIGPVHVVFAVAVLLLIRPATTLLALAGGPLDRRKRISLGYFGIRGIGSLFYITYVIANHERAWNDLMLGTVALTVLLSVLLYGATSDLVIRRYLDAPRERKPESAALGQEQDRSGNG